MNNDNFLELMPVYWETAPSLRTTTFPSLSLSDIKYHLNCLVKIDLVEKLTLSSRDKAYRRKTE